MVCHVIECPVTCRIESSKYLTMMRRATPAWPYARHVTHYLVNRCSPRNSSKHANWGVDVVAIDTCPALNLGHGEYINGSKALGCNCTEEWKGAGCEIQCPQCAHGGVCILGPPDAGTNSTASTAVCQCDEGWSGVLCSRAAAPVARHVIGCPVKSRHGGSKCV
jgi:hypothetical protein